MAEILRSVLDARTPLRFKHLLVGGTALFGLGYCTGRPDIDVSDNATAAINLVNGDGADADNTPHYSLKNFEISTDSQQAKAIAEMIQQAGGPSYSPSEVGRSMIEEQLPKIDALKSVYVKAEQETGVPWYVLAVMDYRENGNHPDKSACAGEQIGNKCVDQGVVIGTSKLDTLIWTGEHAVGYYEKIMDKPYQPENGVTIDDIAALLVGHARGTAPALPTPESRLNFSYNAGFMNEGLDYMRWENDARLNPDDRSRGQPSQQLGAMTLLVGLAEYGQI